MTSNSIGSRDCRYLHVYAKYHQTKCSGSWVTVYTQTILPYLAMVKNPEIRFRDLDLWPIIFKFNGVRAVTKIRVRAKFHRAKCSGSRIIVIAEKKKLGRKPQSVATARAVTTLEIYRLPSASIMRHGAVQKKTSDWFQSQAVCENVKQCIGRSSCANCHVRRKS